MKRQSNDCRFFVLICHACTYTVAKEAEGMSAFERAVQFLPEETGRALLAIPSEQQHRIQHCRSRR